MNQEEYIKLQNQEDSGENSFLELASKSEEDGEVYEYPAIKNKQILDQFLSLFDFEIPPEMYSDFKIFSVPGVDCPCIVYSGLENLDKFRIEKGIVYTQTYFKSVRGFFAVTTQIEPQQKYIFIKAAGLTKQIFCTVLFHEIIHFFNSAKLKKESYTNLEFVFRFFIDEVNAYLFANGKFPVIQQFYYLIPNINGVFEVPTFRTKEEVDTFANIYFTFYKSLYSGRLNLENILDIALNSKDLDEASELLKNTRFSFQGDEDVSLLVRFTQNMFRYEGYQNELKDNHYLVFAEQMMLWSLSKLLDENNQLINHLAKQKVYAIALEINKLHDLEVKYADLDLKLHIYGRQLNTVNNILDIFKNEESFALNLLKFKQNFLEEQVNRLNPVNLREEELVGEM